MYLVCIGEDDFHKIYILSIPQAVPGRWGELTALRALVKTIKEIAQGIEYLHSIGIVHGDIKPGTRQGCMYDCWLTCIHM